MRNNFDGFWFPKELRSELITANTDWVVQYHLHGMPDSEKKPNSVGARWPLLSVQQWELVFRYLESQRNPVEPDYMGRFREALKILFQQFQQPDHPLFAEALEVLKIYTGYSQEMIKFSLSVFDDTSFEAIEKMLRVSVPATARSGFISLPTLDGPEGHVRFYPKQFRFNFLSKKTNPLPFQFNPPDKVLGYASGNVIGTAFIISLLGQVSSLVSHHTADNKDNLAPMILVKNSRQEPLFVPFLFTALEQIDPDLLRNVVIMVWDYQDKALQEMIISKADLVIAAASDHTITQIDELVKNVNPDAQFHQHGHKTSFTTIGKTYLEKSADKEEVDNFDILEKTALLAALDSVLWDQNGCLSSRIHFVEQGHQDHHTAYDYGLKLAEKLRILSQKLPRGMIPLSRIHDRFDHFNAQAISPGLKLCSHYDDDFIVVVDDRPWGQQQFRSIVNTCMDRTIVIRPVESVLNVPHQYLNQIPPTNLQTMYVAIDGKTENSWSEELSQFCELVGKQGVTSIRAVGQSPFAQIAYSWDGYLPQSLALQYPAGHFTTVEFNQNFRKIIQISQWLEQQLV